MAFRCVSTEMEPHADTCGQTRTIMLQAGFSEPTSAAPLRDELIIAEVPLVCLVRSIVSGQSRWRFRGDGGEQELDAPRDQAVVDVPQGSDWGKLSLTAHLGLEARSLPGKGVGLIATQPFKCGDRILSEAPLIAWESTPGPDGVHDWSRLEELVDKLPAVDLRVFYHLFDKDRVDPHARSGKTVRGIWNSNSFPMEDVLGNSGAEEIDGVVRSAIYRICSRFNHTCRPSCYAAWNATLGRQTVHALRDIEAGEEVSIAYVGGAEAGVRARRRELLRGKYLFDCECSACRLELVCCW